MHYISGEFKSFTTINQPVAAANRMHIYKGKYYSQLTERVIPVGG